MHLGAIILPLILFSCSLSLKLPDYFMKCKYPTGFSQCVLKNIQTSLLSIVENGDKVFKIKNLNPMLVKQFTLQANPSLVVELSDAWFGDFKTMVFQDLQMDFKNNNITAKYDLEKFSIDAKYDMDGHLLMLPISGNGEATFLCTGCKGSYNAKLNRYTGDGSNYYKISDDHTIINVSHCVYNLTNLFGGNKQLGDPMIKLLNENWSVLYDEAKEALSTAVSTIMTSVINKYLTQIPISDLVEFDAGATS